MDKKDSILKILKEIESETSRKVAYVNLKNQKTNLTDSKLGGVPYLPKNEKLPVDKEGRQLKLLAQINLNDLEGIYDLPQKGLLQFFALMDMDYGFDIDDATNQDTFRIIYYEEIDESVKEECIAEIYNPYYEDEDEILGYEDEEYRNEFPIAGEFKMEFEVSEEGMSFEDFRYDDIFVEKYNNEFPNEPIDGFFDIDEYDSDFFDEIVNEFDSGNGIKIGGYPCFTQEDPRENEYDEYDSLLLQIDSVDDEDQDICIMWGDGGVCNLFISEDDLKNKDFSKVLYNWDCY